MTAGDPAPGAKRVIRPQKRKYEERSGKGRLKDIDAAERMFHLKALIWGAAVATLAIAVSNVAAGIAGVGPPTIYLFWLGGLVAGFAVYRMTLKISAGGAKVMGHIHNPSGSSTPVVREYSHAQSLAKRGLYADAIEAYEVAVAEFHEDPEPYIRVARIHRDHLQDYEQSVAWFKRARSEATIDPGREIMVTQEIIELYRKRLDAPKRAIPELARMIERFPDHPQADPARTELEALRETLRRSGEH